MDILRSKIIYFLFLMATPLLTGCQIGYLLSSAKGQLSLLNSRVPIEDALKDEKITEPEKVKIRLSQEARAFAKDKLQLNSGKNYSHYVALDRPYVVYTINASPKWELNHYNWWFPVIGSVPYKGFFNEPDAKAEEAELKAKDLDTYLRGVSAYSTLGWFSDPLLSSMIKFHEHDLVNTIIHESVHATLYIKSSADFNERLAVFIGNTGTLDFYKAKEGENSPTVKTMQSEFEDEKIFSEYISNEIKELEKWYKLQTKKDEVLRQTRIKEIQTRFKELILPKMKSDMFNKFPDLILNNARIMLYKTYVADLSDFQKLYDQKNHNMNQFLEACKSLEFSKHPEEDLKQLVSKGSH
jgi:predicted aminopeptidase